MHNPQHTESFAATTSDLRLRLQVLYLERAVAGAEGLSGNRSYMDDLEEESASTRSSYVGAAVTEIASLRGELDGRLEG